MSVMRFSAAGDAMIFRRLPESYEGLEEISAFIRKGDFRYVNLETTLHRFESFAAAESGGSWLCSDPDVLDDIKRFGFNIISSANNHAMDYSYEGLRRTKEYIREAGFPAAGIGETMAEASAPAYVDMPGGRAAMIACCSTFHPSESAGEQTRQLRGRPGLNTIRYTTEYYLDEARMNTLRDIASGIYINGNDDILRSEGYLPQLPEGTMKFGTLSFKKADCCGKKTFVNEKDMQRILDTIREAKFMTDYVVISIHSHEIKTLSKEEPADFLEEFAHRCIDGGANAVIGTGPHLLRPVEIYKGCPIFYSIGDFIIQLENIQRAPADMYAGQGLTGLESLDVMFNKRSDNGKRGLCYSKVMYEAVIPYWEVKDGKLTELTLLPIELNFDKPRSQNGWPRVAYNEKILERLRDMSRSYGTEIEIQDGLGKIRIEGN